MNVQNFMPFENTRERNFPITFEKDQPKENIDILSPERKDEKNDSMSPTFKPEKLEYMRDLPL